MQIIVVIVVIALVLIALFVFKRKAPSQLSPGAPGSPEKTAEDVTPPAGDAATETGGETEAAEQVEATEDADGAGATDAVEEPVPEEPVAEGVRLDEAAETAAADSLREARRDRKLQKLRQGLAKTRGGFIDKIAGVFKEKKEIDADLLNELEEVLITADIGAGTTEWLISILKGALDKDELKSPEAVWELLRAEIQHALTVEAPAWDPARKKPFTIMVVGVNGAGKTTTIGKLASQLTEQGLKVVLAAGDTFRAAAVNQLEIWGRRTGSEVVPPQKEGADPASVVHDAVKRAIEVGADVVIADTAGRLHTQAPLMEELKKIHRVMGKALEGAPHEVLLTVDATTGQNALQQAREFGDALPLTGVILTKLDGTAKGGVIVGICHERKIPIRFIGIGEAKSDLRAFSAADFVDALFHRDADDE
ncbi:MAG: signal recognition particle-docking protein FtsY [Proteobacteria bacterium]|nr:signal recognition particle-docking protein FtsY [Pseudomonadota bacterium]